MVANLNFLYLSQNKPYTHVMKKLFYVLFAVALMACGGKPSVEGKWQLESVSGEELSESEKSSTMDIKEGGALEMTRGEMKMEGTWKLSDDGKTMTVTMGGRTQEWTEVEVDGDHLSFKEKDDKITLKKM